MRVFVVLFNARTENEGIHSLKVGDRNIVLMFEDEDDATRFGGLLEAQDFPPCSVEGFESEEIEEFCHGAGYEAKHVETGTLVMPPDQNLETTDWDPETRPGGLGSQSSPADMDRDMSQNELDRIRQQLENLL
ncbi:DUF3110 domain-containing protein [Leptothoe sp. PORK10 BA2]|uniref:DUF3110 domain-containing protein n=1 Tax=Leptothoe sp. PORK10 BA2 TaxID=3110254 RepID=UPI002B1F872B|nr:DUF3110 domain-containing protein [Leptothoe sp. PORK10 BA2]MEA5464211.1 DUF3110 domain-containing protein [Leptothoe sp. PORK10 BA2]